MDYRTHFTELRRRALAVLVVLGVCFALSLALDARLYHYLTIPLTALGLKLVAFGPGEVVTVLFALAGWTTIGLTAPFALSQAWRFAAPGLHAQERRMVMAIAPAAALLFLMGLAFSWFLVFPRILGFLVALTKQEGMGLVLQAKAYFSFLIGICVPIGFAFEVPLALVALAKLELITAIALRRVRKYAYLVIVVLGVLISPPELVSHLSITVPMMGLYEVGIAVVTFMERRGKVSRG